MSGICTPVINKISMMSEDGSIAVNFNKGDQFDFHMDERHCDRLVVNVYKNVAISMTVKQFYDTFDIVWRNEK